METPFADDVLHGAEEIAGFLYGDARQRRRVFYLVEKSRLPVFRMGATICMRRSTWFEWVKAQERKASGNSGHMQQHPSIKLMPEGDESGSPNENPAETR